MDSLATNKKRKHTLPVQGAVGKNKGGRPKLDASVKLKGRTFKMSDADFDRLKALAEVSRKSTAEVVRRSIKEFKIRQAPNVKNMQAWVDLSRVVSNLNQISFRLNYVSKGGEKDVPTIDELAKIIDKVNENVSALRHKIREIA